MKLKHKVVINVTDERGKKEQVLKGASLSLPKKLMNFFLGEKVQLLILQPGQSVQDVSVHEIKEGGEGA